MGVTKILNIAHPHYYMLGAFTFGLFYSFLSFNWVLATIAAMLITGLLGGISYALVFSPLRKDFLFVITVSTAIGMICVQGIIVIFGERDIIVPAVFRGIINVRGFIIPYERLMIIIFGLLIMLFLRCVLNTKIGKAMHAVALDEEAAALQGINTGNIFLVAMFIGCGLAGIAGAIMTPIFTAKAHMGTYILSTVLLVVIVGGFGSIKGSIIVGFLIGLAESFGYQLLGSSNIILILIFIGIIIYLRPGGLFGRFRELI
jgi:branched-chain amino acid transport system permease protein